MKFKILTAVLVATVMAFSTIAASADSVDTSEEMYEVDVLENAGTASTAATVTYDRSSKIIQLTQKESGECATTCAAMCVKKTRDQLIADGFNMKWADWYGIGSKYGYSVEWLGTKDINGTTDGLKKIYNYLKAGYPVCVWINSNESTYHWVTVYKYSGDGVNFKASDFMCIDPARRWTSTSRNRSLDSAHNYAGVYNIVVFK